MFKYDTPNTILSKTMNYNHISVIIPILATGYVFTVYLILILAQRGAKITRNQSWQQSAAESRTTLH
jgi:hypothetical protein